MAQSPSPGPFAPVGQAQNARRLSPSPPPSQQPLSKREKKRSIIDQRLKETVTNFRTGRDFYLRAQINTLSRDMHFITMANPYQEKPLDDEEGDLTVVTAQTKPKEGDPKLPLGQTALKFVDEINNEMETRDANITTVYNTFNTEKASIKLDYEFAVQVAEAESQALKESARNRVIASIQAKKRNMQKEKEQLDNADAAFLMNSNALTAVTTPGSPLGGYGNRKTRHTRHRQDLEGLDGTEGGKRKRKAQSELENGSPAPGSKVGYADSVGPLLWDKAKDGERPLVPTIDRYFPARELAAQQRTAHTTVAQTWCDKPVKKGGGRLRVGGGGAAEAGSGDVSDPEGRGGAARSDDEPEQEDLAMLAAPVMERTGSHATRSTRINQAEFLSNRDSLENMDDPHRIYGAAVLDASAARARVLPSKDIEAPMTGTLPQQAVMDDLGIIASLMEGN